VTAKANKIPVSVDYTGRDYYSLREELITRVKAATNQKWQGNDPADFGLALIEAFAYMGDLMNYYIDRVANESYLATATQRQTLLNIASMYGYTPTGYVGSTVDATFTGEAGYRAKVSQSVLGTVTIDGTDYPHSARLAFPPLLFPDADTVFEVDASIIVANMTETAYNGTYKIIDVGLDNESGYPVVTYTPSWDISSIAMMTGGGANADRFMVTTTASHEIQTNEVVLLEGAGNFSGQWKVKESGISGNLKTFSVDLSENSAPVSMAKGVTGTPNKIYYYSDTNFGVGQKVTVSGVTASGGTGSFNQTDKAITAVTNKTGSVITLIKDGSDAIINSDKTFVVGDLVTISGVTPSGYNTTLATPVLSRADDLTCNITNAVGNGATITYTTSTNTFIAGQYVTVTGIVPNGLNCTEARIITASATSFTVAGISVATFQSGDSTGVARVPRIRIATSGTGSYDPTNGAGTIACHQFVVDASCTATYTSGGTATPTASGTASAGTIYYADINAADWLPDLDGDAYVVGSVEIPAGTQLKAEISYEDKVEQLIFTTQSKAVVGYTGNPQNEVSVQAIQGEDVQYRADNLKDTTVNPYDINGELLGFSNGEPDQTMTLKETIVDKALVKVYVDSGIAFGEWTQVTHLADYGPNAAVYTVSIDASGYVRINFGDGVSGAIPPKDNAVKAGYYAGGGASGNIPAKSLNSTIFSIPLAVTAEVEQALKDSVSVSNLEAAAGGSDPESNDVIRYNAPRTLVALNRAVTLNDYANLALSLRGVGKANATGITKNSVTVYVAPSQSDSVSDTSPGVVANTGEPTAAMSRLMTRVADYLDERKQIGTTVTVLQPDYVEVELTIDYTKLPQYLDSSVAANIRSALVNKFSYTYVDFEDVITPEEIEYKLRQVDGVRNAKVTALHRKGGAATDRVSLIGEPSEIFIFTDAGVTLNTSPTDATLSDLVPSVAFNQSFDPDILSYTVNLDSSTSTFSITPTVADATNAILTINSEVKPSATIWTKTGLVGGEEFKIVLSVTAGDGVTVRNYRISVVKVA
jgi:hypothetical protein